MTHGDSMRNRSDPMSPEMLAEVNSELSEVIESSSAASTATFASPDPKTREDVQSFKVKELKARMKAAEVDFSHCLEKRDMVELYMEKVFVAPADSSSDTAEIDESAPVANPHTIVYATKGDMLDLSTMMIQIYEIVNKQTADMERDTALR